ncbi:MAG: tRNA (adenosine(37)-N6)-threonylcarbamoyltransferase complex dimerization subunit type 1 TsaB [Nitrospiraceae bacterium]|nr:tRNA (adenosine(37)-N6)-threonylcarbamoyltransferase complex dimerization subunit type 1 TsaB [Nitrospiraceae bacterium]
MKVLSIETSTMLGGVAIVDEETGLVAETRLNVKTTHSERLMTVIDHVLEQSEMGLDNIDAFAVAIGPGSFTGLRIGLSTAKGLSYATGKPIVAVPTLEAFAYNFSYCSYPVCLMLDARKREVYAAVFKWEGGAFRRVIEDTSIKAEDLLRKFDQVVLFAGEGAALYKSVITEIMKERAVFASPEKMVPSPANVAVLGLSKAARGEFADALAAVPRYIRKSEAEVKWSERV